MTDQEELIQILNSGLAIELPDRISLEKLKEELSRYIHQCIETDFQKLITLLYRVDVSEPKLRRLLQENPDADAGIIIADLVIERQLQKIRSRREHRRRDDDLDIDDEERW